MKYVHFFAIKDDLLTFLELAEGKGPLKYARTGNFARDEIQSGISVWDSGTTLPGIEKASADSSTACESYLVFEPETPINLRHLQGVNGERICVDQLVNPDSVEFTPGGVWDDDVVLQGRIATVSQSQISQALMKRFQAAIKKTCTKVKSFYVGPKALSLLTDGKRLTSSARSPREFDLADISRNA